MQTESKFIYKFLPSFVFLRKSFNFLNVNDPISIPNTNFEDDAIENIIVGGQNEHITP
jgi:hypothetical protein